MNDPIRELWAQCVRKHTKTPMNWQDVADEFAELIVKDCTYQCYLIGESGLAHELSDKFGFKFDFRKMMEDEDE